MAKIDLTPLENVALEGINKKLEIFNSKGFKWHGFMNFLGSTNYSIVTPQFIIEENLLIDYFSNLKFLEFGNKEHLTMYRALDVLRLLYTRDYLMHGFK